MATAISHWAAVFSDPSVTWDDLRFLREHTRLPLVLKGILHPDDARRAAELGMDGVIVSNHGGRQVDGAVAALDALPGVVSAAGKMPGFFDSGVRTGADIVKALALGAKAVLLSGGRYAYGLALAGGRREDQSGVAGAAGGIGSYDGPVRGVADRSAVAADAATQC